VFDPFGFALVGILRIRNLDAGFDSQSLPGRRPSSVSDFRRAAARLAGHTDRLCECFCNFGSILSHGCELEVNTSNIGW
jgi:hypothetical protein